MRSRWDIHQSGFAAIDHLLSLPAFMPRDRAWELMFVAAMREAFELHYERSPEFRGHADLVVGAEGRPGYRVEDIRTLDDVENIPWIHVQNFKEADLLSVTPNEVVRTFTSSGTGGAKTKLFVDAVTLNRLEATAYSVYRDLGVLPRAGESERETACHYLLFTYDIAHAPDLGTAWTDVTIADMLPGGEREFLLRHRDGEFRFDLEHALSAYGRFVESGRPLRLLGFPAFMYHTFLEARKRGLPPLSVAAARQSWVLTGGGWKNHRGEAISKAEFAGFIHQATGIPVTQVRDMFGMSEHGVGYVDCEHGRLHVPAYAHAITRDPKTLRKLPAGAPGMLQLFTPLLKSYPSLSLLTTDEVRLDETPCPCGRSGAGLEVVGRLGLQHHQSCALRALEYLTP